MFTLKIRWQRVVTQEVSLTAVTTQDAVSSIDHGNHSAVIDSVEDEATHFIPANSVVVTGPADPNMRAWSKYDYVDLRSHVDTPAGDGMMKSEPMGGARLIEVEHGGEHSWYLVTTAWLLGPTGDTIERIAP